MMAKLMYKPVGLVAGVASGLIAGVIFKQVWRIAAGENDTPNATDERRRWAEVLVAAALQGAIFAVVKATVDRGGAIGVKRVTGKWPA